MFLTIFATIKVKNSINEQSRNYNYSRQKQPSVKG